MEEQEARQQFDKGTTALDHGHLHLALTCFQRAEALAPSLASDSYIAYCLAAIRQEHEHSIDTLRANLARQPDAPLHHLLLGRVLILAGRRGEALDVLRQGVRLDASGLILQELEQFGSRKPPVFPGLSRTNPLNRLAGLLLSRLGLR
jgi:tetratricopeptide (TPR) repeat protein